MLMTLKEELPHISSTVQVVKIMTDILHGMNQADRDKECLWTILMDNRNYVRGIDMIYMGSSCGMPVSTREIFRVAVSSGATSVIVTHNHPGRTTDPSPEDLVVYKKLRRASAILGIRFLDFIIFTIEGRYFSLMDQKVR